MWRIEHLLLWLCLAVIVQGQNARLTEVDKEAIVDPHVVQEKWSQMIARAKELTESGVKALLPKLMEGMGSVNISSECVRQSMKIMYGLRKLQPWAVKFVDSSAKSIDGVLSITIASLGSFDECVDNIVIENRGRKKGQELFRGQYCRIRMKPYLPPKRKVGQYSELKRLLENISYSDTAFAQAVQYSDLLYSSSLSMGVCVPSGCSKEDLNELITKGADYLGVVAKATACETKDERQITPLMIGVMFAFSFAGFLLLLGSLIDIYCYYSGKNFQGFVFRVLKSFSFVTNFEKFIDTSTSEKTISCLHGMRFLSMSWIILGHTYLSFVFQLHSAPHDFKSYLEQFDFQVVLNGTMAVDTFFFMTALLVSYTATKLVKIGKKRFNVILYIVHRIWRIVPVYAFTIAYLFIIPLTMNGPLNHETTDHFINACKKNWWASLLFINNFYDTKNTCIPHGWYLSLDMQFYIGALIVLIPLMRSTKVGVSIAVFFILVGVIASGANNYIYSLPPTFSLNVNLEDVDSIMTNEYMRPHSHLSVYAIGILSGYFLAMRPDFKIPKKVQFLGWCVAIIFGMTTVYGPNRWNSGIQPTLVETIFYSSCYRTAWALAIAWMVICCCTGHGGVINYILTWKMWIPLGRLCFIAYLVHPGVMMSYIGNIRTAIDIPAHFIAVWIYLGHLVITFAASFAGSMLIEAPFLSLEKVVFGKYTKDQKRHNLDIASSQNGLRNKVNLVNIINHEEKIEDTKRYANPSDRF